jgi:hypothetical protein
VEPSVKQLRAKAAASIKVRRILSIISWPKFGFSPKTKEKSISYQRQVQVK